MKLCIVCHTKEEFAFSKHKYDIYTCPNCGLKRTNLKQPYSKLIKNYYDKNYFTGGSNRAGYANYSDDHSIVRRNARAYLKRLKEMRSKGKLLDVGCATGIFMQEAQHRDYDTYGIDPSAYAINVAKRYFGNKVRHATLINCGFKKNSFDVITFFDVFEHLDNPTAMLEKSSRLLKKDGVIMINTGNTDSFMARLEKKHWHFYIPPQHVYFYSKTNLLLLLSQHGFMPAYTNAKGKYLSLRYLLQLMRTIDHSLAAKLLYPLVKKNFIGKIPFYFNLGDNMTIVAKKTHD